MTNALTALAAVAMGDFYPMAGVVAPEAQGGSVGL